MLVILNPASRHGAGRRLRPLIERELRGRGVTCEVVETEAPGHALILAREAAESGVARIVAAGGDGTVHEVANGMMAVPDCRAALGLIPIGTGNDFVKMVRGTSGIARACATVAAGNTSALDVGVARWSGETEYFVNAMGTGIDVEVVRQMRRSRVLPGGVIYVSALLRALMKYRPLPVTLNVDGRVMEQRIMNLAVCNGPSIGGSFRICPDARPDDGLLDICVIAEMSVVRNARMVPRVLTGTHAGRAGVSMLRGAGVHISVADGRPLLFQLDGELREAADGADGVRVDLVPGCLNVISGAAEDTARNE